MYIISPWKWVSWDLVEQSCDLPGRTHGTVHVSSGRGSQGSFESILTSLGFLSRTWSCNSWSRGSLNYNSILYIRRSITNSLGGYWAPMFSCNLHPAHTNTHTHPLCSCSFPLHPPPPLNCHTSAWILKLPAPSCLRLLPPYLAHVKEKIPKALFSILYHLHFRCGSPPRNASAMMRRYITFFVSLVWKYSGPGIAILALAYWEWTHSMIFRREERSVPPPKNCIWVISLASRKASRPVLDMNPP